MQFEKDLMQRQERINGTINAEFLTRKVAAAP
jgi:hypothetical protein